MEPLLRALMVWASAQTGLPASEELPVIRIADQCEIERIYYDDATKDCGDSAMRIQAIYDPRASLMHLPEGWSENNIYDVSMLVHEIVHHLQARAGITAKTVNCIGRDVEKPAYDAQIAWLEAAGLDAFETMGINGLSYHMLTICENPSMM